MSRRLPCFFRYMFAFLTGLMVAATVAVLVILILNPQIAHLLHGAGQFGISSRGVDFAMNNSGTKLAVTHVQVTFTGLDAGLMRVFVRFVLPLALLYTMFFAVLFDLLRRLFRNVERGESFSPKTVRLVRIIGFSLIGFSLVSAVAETYPAMMLMNYLRTNIGSPALSWAINGETMPSYFSPFFFSGLLVLALSEVFRQGFALKADADLTI